MAAELLGLLVVGPRVFRKLIFLSPLQTAEVALATEALCVKALSSVRTGVRESSGF